MLQWVYYKLQRFRRFLEKGSALFRHLLPHFRQKRGEKREQVICAVRDGLNSSCAKKAGSFRRHALFDGRIDPVY